MKFAAPLIEGVLIQRYKRFLADVRLADGTTITATCPNTGSMKGLRSPGARVWLSESDSPTRKYRHTWEMIETDVGAGPVMVGINTNHPNALVAEAIAGGLMPDIGGFESARREVKYGLNSRIDLLLEDKHKGKCYVEVKNVHLLRTPGLAEFPDSKTERGAKHLAELTAMIHDGHRAVMVFLIQRPDAERFQVAGDIDPAYAAAFEKAAKAGVEMLAYRCALDPAGITVTSPVPLA
ncbi:MAG: DNA/RNA nuclease SfsA [Hyphomicrobium sp.]